MDLGRFLVRVLMLCLIGTTSPSSDGSCSCSEIPKMALTNPPEETCNGTANKFRYVCVQGYVRKAGTSNLLKCQSGQWASSPDLSCIPDPKATNKPANSSAQPNITTQAPLSLDESKLVWMFRNYTETTKAHLLPTGNCWNIGVTVQSEASFPFI
ncbi:interleukin-15 receptor subunit alpha [Nematolebias whitei]|uniref:interleukin-15 receptor subunit alpha n=1 Tax=Nematolebias whitei TaxID=451745 RepID=UPI00189AD743|nr:interleukin-15 receptor subunit alpha [Nematolebias whitei]